MLCFQFQDSPSLTDIDTGFVIFSTEDGVLGFTEGYEVTTDFCRERGSYVITYDANNDGSADLLCKSDDGSLTIMEGHIGQ